MVFEIDGNNHLLEAIRRLVLILHLPFVPSDSSLCCLKNQYWKEKNKQSQKSHHTHLQRSLENLRIWDRLWNVELVLIPQMFVSYLCNHTLCPVNFRTMEDILKRNNIVIPKNGFKEWGYLSIEFIYLFSLENGGNLTNWKISKWNILLLSVFSLCLIILFYFYRNIKIINNKKKKSFKIFHVFLQIGQIRPTWTTSAFLLMLKFWKELHYKD